MEECNLKGRRKRKNSGRVNKRKERKEDKEGRKGR